MPHVFLTGPRASGKSTLGTLLAERLQLSCIDMDLLIQQRIGTSIAAFVHDKGWEAFRTVESDVLAELCAQPGQIIATGGGIVLAQENRELLNTCGFTLYLQAGVATLLDRLQQAPMEAQRPALSSLPQETELEKTLQDREPLYLACADAVLDASAPLQQLLQQALDALQTR